MRATEALGYTALIQLFHPDFRLIVNANREALRHAKELIALTFAGVEGLEQRDLLGLRHLNERDLLPPHRLLIKPLQSRQKPVSFGRIAVFEQQVHVPVHQGGLRPWSIRRWDNTVSERDHGLVLA